jgi:hypothetical protein
VRLSNKEDPNDSSAKVWFDDTVGLNELSEAKAANAGENDFASETWGHIFDSAGNLLQTVRFHTSCSQPLSVGNQFGSLFVFGMDTTDGGEAQFGAEVEYTYTITNNGDIPRTNVTVIDDTFGEVPSSPISSIAPGETVVLTLIVNITEETTNTVNLAVSPTVTCGATDSTTITIAEPPASCCEDGGLRVLTLRYTGEDCMATDHEQDPSKVFCDGDPAGEDDVFIRASDKEDPNDSSAKVWFEGPVALNGMFELNALSAGENKLKADTWVHVSDSNGALLQVVKFHTSCSQPIFLGNQFGSLVVDDCVGEHEPIEGSCCEDGGLRVLTLRYTGADCMATDHWQDPSKVYCDGDPMLADPVFIRASDKEDPNDSSAKVWFEGPVALNGMFELNALSAGENKLKSDTWVHVFDVSGNLLQVVKFHTSCSQPLVVGNQFGSVVVEYCVGEHEPIQG